MGCYPEIQGGPSEAPLLRGREGEYMREPGFSQETHKILRHRYEALSPKERGLLRFAAILTEPVPRETLLSGCMALLPENPPEEILSLLETLHHLELLVIPPPFEDFWHVPREIREFATREALEEKRYIPLRDAGEALLPLQRFSPYIGYPQEEGWKLFRSIRRSFYSGNWNDLEKELSLYEKIFSATPPEGLSRDPLFDICTSPFDGSWLCEHLPAGMVFRVLAQLESRFYTGEDFSLGNALWQTLTKILMRFPEAPEKLRRSWYAPFFSMLHSYFLFSGDTEILKSLAPLAEEWIFEVHRACEAFFSGNIPESLLFWEEALQKRLSQGSQGILPFPYSSLYVLALLLQEDRRLWEKAQEYLKHWRSVEREPSEDRDILLRLLAFRRGFQQEAEQMERLFPSSRLARKHPFTRTLFFLALFWISPDHLPRRSEELVDLYRHCRERTLHRLGAECAGLLHAGEPRGYEEMAVWGDSFLENLGNPPLRTFMALKREWQRVLEALENLREDLPTNSPREERLTWRIEMKHRDSQRPKVQKITPWIQKRLSRGGWSSGAEITLKKLFEEDRECSLLSPQDRTILNALEEQPPRRGKTPLRHSSFLQALSALRGHDRIFSEEDPREQLQLRGVEPELHIRQHARGFSLELRPFPSQEEREQGFVLLEEHPGSLMFFVLSERHRKILGILGDSPKLEIPSSGRENLLRALKSLSGAVSILSEIGGELPADTAAEREGEYRPSVRLLPEGEGLYCELRVYPLGEKGPAYRPGQGGSLLILSLEGTTWQVARSLEKEAQTAERALSCCGALERGYQESPWSWHLSNPQDCLELLVQIRECPEIIRVEWPKGESLKITRPLSFDDLSVKIASREHWFTLSGALRIDTNRMLDLKELLENMGKHPGQFIPLKNGEFLALTREFRRRLQDLQAFSIPKGKELLFHPSAAPELHPLFLQTPPEDLPPEWTETIERFKTISKLIPQVPSSFQGKLRNYQEEGFRWLVRMASLELGACLADDMGLGKTIQALAVLLYLGGKGPSLVLAPTSVCMNWLREARRFTPTLTMSFLGEGNREELLANPGPCHVVLCSYGLLHNEVGALEKISWNCIVLDEGQAIKNPRTQRWKNVMKLRGNFRLITSGTPLENHLGELWSLFRFLNPGLLGSLKSFNSRFAFPIEKERDSHAAKRLKRLLEPFLLRRTKSQVLEELPPKTEILLSVQLSPEEASLYEALRRQALAEAQNAALPQGQRRIRILAHIMKLRRACCHPRLILPESGFGSSKLKALEKILWDLEENQHRALVFSQFVDHLSLVRAFLDRRGISYQYLDGNTPLRERKKRVDTFQREEATCFLISLKAGGMGLNLTAADYVVHLDPWWNPAVEDQASDRAHRIGQTRPVTIYRMVAEGTIEEKIVALHGHKRTLAEDILQGREQIPEISMEELLGLLRKE